ncbi:MAG: glutamyl-tRNA reductase [Pseudomonadota bacterium]
MPILAYGINFRTAPLEVRERLAFPAEVIENALRDFTTEVSLVSEAAILSTCNRTELYCAVAETSSEATRDWLADHHALPSAAFDEHVYAYWEQDAVSHIIRVAAGLDSQVLGEPQILGQMKTAWDTSRATGTMGPELNLLSDVSLNVAKRIRTETDIGKNPVSIAFAAVSMARNIFSDLAKTNVLLVGAGETIELVAEHLNEQGIGQLAVANRSLPNARRVAERFAGRAFTFTDLPELLPQYDIVISSTGSPLPVIGKGAVEAALRRRRHRVMLMIDIAVPRDIEPEVAELRDVYLYSVDDLNEIIEQGNRERQRAAASAESIVREGTQSYLRKRRIQDSGETLRALRDRSQQIQATELERALRHWQKTGDAEAALELLARSLTNKLIHPPTQMLRDASAEGRTDLVDFLRAAYDLK